MTDDFVPSNRNLRPVTIQTYGECTLLTVGKSEIWDGAELALLRETIRRLIEEEGCRTLGINMSYVKCIPSGFFGTLCHWYDEGVRVRLFGTLPNVKQMLWFTECFHSIGGEFHELRLDDEGEFEEATPECDEVEGPVTVGEFLSTLNDERTSSVPAPGIARNPRQFDGTSNPSMAVEPGCTSTKCPPVAGILAK